jgi:tRNA(fMet)-specific endonuclease VapC
VLKYLLDTDCCIYLLAGGSEALNRRVAAQPEGSVGISAVTLAELAVKYRGELSAAPALAELLESLPPQPFDDAAAWAYGRLPFKRGSYDRLIAGHALALGVTLVTNNDRDFTGLPDLMVENWSQL